MILFDVGMVGFVAGYYDFQLFGRAKQYFVGVVGVLLKNS